MKPLPQCRRHKLCKSDKEVQPTPGGYRLGQHSLERMSYSHEMIAVSRRRPCVGYQQVLNMRPRRLTVCLAEVRNRRHISPAQIVGTSQLSLALELTREILEEEIFIDVPHVGDRGIMNPIMIGYFGRIPDSASLADAQLKVDILARQEEASHPLCAPQHVCTHGESAKMSWSFAVYKLLGDLLWLLGSVEPHPRSAAPVHRRKTAADCAKFHMSVEPRGLRCDPARGVKIISIATHDDVPSRSTKGSIIGSRYALAWPVNDPNALVRQRFDQRSRPVGRAVIDHHHFQPNAFFYQDALKRLFDIICSIAHRHQDADARLLIGKGGQAEGFRMRPKSDCLTDIDRGGKEGPLDHSHCNGLNKIVMKAAQFESSKYSRSLAMSGR